MDCKKKRPSCWFAQHLGLASQAGELSLPLGFFGDPDARGGGVRGSDLHFVGELVSVVEAGLAGEVAGVLA